MEEKIASLTRQLEDLTGALCNDEPSLKAHSAGLWKLSEAADAFARQNRGHLGYIMNIIVNVAQVPALELLEHWGAFQHIPPDGTISYQELAGKIDADAAITARLARVLVSTGVLKQVGDDEVAHTRISATLSSRRFYGLLQAGMENHFRGMSHMRSYFAQYGRREPVGQRNTIMAYALGDPSLTHWEHMNRNETHMKNFMAAMSALAASMGGVEVYDFSRVVAAGENESDRILVVDVGGGRGHSLEAIFKTTPNLDMSRCVVEDLPIVIEEAKKLADGELKKASFVGMDFHTDQPVKGALVYLIRRCLHDYSDDDSINILQHIRDAMRPDSRLLIVEQVINNPPAAIDAANDIFMAIIGGKERTRADFEEIARRAGLEVRDIHRGQANVAVVECAPV